MSSEGGRRPVASLGIGTALMAAALLCGCGKKGPPRPPPSLAPTAVQDLEVRQRGDGLLLTMSYPQTAVSGLALPGLRRVEIWEIARPAPGGEAPAVDAREFAASARPRRSLEGPELAAATSGDRLSVWLPLEAPLPEAPTVRILGARAVSTSGETSAFSNLAAILPAAPPPPPDLLSVQPGPDGVTLRWRDPGGGIAGFRIYRRAAEARAYGEALHRAPPEARSYTDPTARFGERYIYSVASVASPEPLVESALASEREVLYEDRFPPPPPPGLVALPEPGRIRLLWEPSAAPDAAGYLVERAAPGEGFRPLFPEPIDRLQAVDEGVLPGTSYRYRVRAVDGRGNRGQAGPAVEVRVP